MQGFNHVAGGVAFTGIFASFTEVNIFEKPEYLGLTIFCSVLPDIDHTRSLIGKSFFPLAKWLNNKFGHRTITHSLVFWLAAIFLVRLVEIMYFKNAVYSTIVAFSILSHDLFDMCTKQGILFFYPFSKRPVVLPGNSNLRLATNDLKSEAIIFVGFISLTAFCMPLFANGFWQVYRKAFLNYKQLNAELLKSKDMLEIKFITKENADTTNGIIISLTDGVLILSKKNEFVKFENPRELTYLDYKHTKKTFETKQIKLFNVSEDSLKYYLKFPILKGEIQSNNEMNYFEGAILKSAKVISFEYQTGFSFTTIVLNNDSKIAEIEIEKAKKLKEINEYNQIQNQLDELYSEKSNGLRNYKSLSDYEKGKMQKRLSECEVEIERLEKVEYPFLLDFDKKIEGLENEIKLNEVRLNANLLVWVK
jgi:inner membrane protein